MSQKIQNKALQVIRKRNKETKYVFFVLLQLEIEIYSKCFGKLSRLKNDARAIDEGNEEKAVSGSSFPKN